MTTTKRHGWRFPADGAHRAALAQHLRTLRQLFRSGERRPLVLVAFMLVMVMVLLTGVAWAWIRALPPGSLQGPIRITEQGEVLPRKYAHESNAHYHLELLVADVSAEPDYVAGVSQAVSEMAVPLSVDDEVIGVLQVDNRAAPGIFRERDLEMRYTAMSSEATHQVHHRLVSLPS